MLDAARPVGHVRPKRKTRARFSKVANARDTIRGFGHDMDVAGLTFGQFSLLDLIEATLEVTGPADVAISTWSAGFYDVETAQKFRDLGKMRSVRFVMDIARKRGQADVTDIADLFGPESIRTVRSHAKFALITNDEWAVLITSSMNLNLNPRIEHFEMTDDVERAGIFMEFVDALFEELPEGGDVNENGNQRQVTPVLAGLDAVQPDYGVKVGKVAGLGRANVGRDAG